LNHDETEVCVRAERAFLRKLEGGCQVPIAAHAMLRGGSIVMEGLVGDVKGTRIIKGRNEGPKDNFRDIGTALAEDLLSRGAKKILDEVYGQS
jgi:hydroxymethylbilane synthase